MKLFYSNSALERFLALKLKIFGLKLSNLFHKFRIFLLESEIIFKREFLGWR